MSRLLLENLVPKLWDRARMVEVVNKITTQLNGLSEGKIVNRYGALTSVPTTGTFQVGDFTWNSNTTDLGGYILLGWICVAAGTPGTQQPVYIGFSTPGTGTTKYRQVFKPRDNEPPTSNFATLDTRNGHPVLDFDTNTQETAIFSGVISASYAGGNITVTVIASLTTATTGTLGWDVTFERVGTSQDIDADGWATPQTITATTVPGTSGQMIALSVSITAGAAGTDGLAAGEAYRLRIRRDVANDNAAGDAELWAVVVSEN